MALSIEIQFPGKEIRVRREEGTKALYKKAVPYSLS